MAEVAEVDEMDQTDQMDELIPCLRLGVRVEPLAEGAAALVDPVFETRVRLDARGALLVAALDEPQPLSALAERLGADPAALLGILGNFDRYHLLATPAAEAAARAASATAAHAIADPESLPLLIREDARFSCTMCGSCCGGHTVGPVMPDVLAGLEPLMDALAARTRSEKGLFFVLPPELGGQRGAPSVMCHAAGGSCVFLDDDARCVIHADYGADMKPRACRLFPYQFVATPDGVAVTISDECRGYADARRGKALRDDEAAIRRLLALVPQRQALPKRLRLDAATALSWDAYGTLERGLHDALDAASDHGAALLALRQAIVEAGAAVPDEPRTTPELRRDLDQLCGALADFLAQLQNQIGEETEALVIHVESLGPFESALRGLRADLRRVALPLRREQHALFVDLMHHRLMSKALLEGDTVVDRFARLAFGWLVARAIMIARARQVKRRHLGSQDVMDAVVLTSFVLRNEVLGDAIAPFAGAIRSLFFNRLDTLLGAAEALPDPDLRVELYRF